ncbi:MAG: hypothetical protein WEA77_06010 [Hyphomonas sp.]
MLIVGYGMTERLYLVRKSWAGQGYRWTAFETMDALSRQEDF